ncbi:MAG TPA: superoxide dismutase family protein [Gemmatimonadales bacterium]
MITSSTLVACGDTGRRDAAPAGDTAAVTQDTGATAGGGKVTVALRDSAGKDLGTLTLSDAGQAIALSGRLSGLPTGEHGIHIHTVGQCDGPKFETAGDHWNPTNRKHGKDAPGGPHLGDLANITAGQDGSASVETTTPGGTLRGADAALDSDGAAVVVHAKRDDYKTQPSGNSGDRIACGVVR